MRKKAKLTDTILPVDVAADYLERRLGQSGWKRSSLLRKIKNDYPFRWIEGVHYLRSARGISALNVDAIVREILDAEN